MQPYMSKHTRTHSSSDTAGCLPPEPFPRIQALMWFQDADTPAAVYTQTSLPANISTQAGNCHTHVHTPTHSLSHTLTCAVQLTESC